ncbi:MAG: CAP domain-containing protein [bacterium]
MAGFEGTRVGPLFGAAREWRPGRFAPLYVAGILAGVGLGIGVATWPGESSETRPHALAVAVQTIDDAPVFGIPMPVTPELPAVGVNPPLAVELPEAFNAAFAGWYLPAMPVVVEAAPAVAPIAVPQAPVASAPTGAQPAAQPPVQAAPAQAAPANTGKPNFYVPQVSAGPSTSMEIGLFNLINAERAKEGLAPYVLESGLTKIARTRSQQLVDQNYFAHTDPYGYSMYVELLAYFGYSSYAWAGENLAMNNWPAATAGDEAIRGLMASPTHRANIMASDFTRIGVGEVTTADGRHFYAMIFLS